MAKKMIDKIHYNYSSRNGGKDIALNVDLSRFDKQYGKAQFALDSMVMTSMIPYMPMHSGVFVNVTKGMSAAIAGSGTVVAAAPPFGRFLYNGKVMVDEKTRSPWARVGARKVVTNTDLNYYKGVHPSATSHWFETAKKNHGKSWIEATKKIAGGG